MAFEFPEINGLEGVFDLITSIITPIIDFIRKGVIQIVPVEWISVTYLLLAFLGGWLLRDKIPIPAFVLIGITFFVILKYI